MLSGICPRPPRFAAALMAHRHHRRSRSRGGLPGGGSSHLELAIRDPGRLDERAGHDRSSARYSRISARPSSRYLGPAARRAQAATSVSNAGPCRVDDRPQATRSADALHASRGVADLHPRLRSESMRPAHSSVDSIGSRTRAAYTPCRMLGCWPITGGSDSDMPHPADTSRSIGHLSWACPTANVRTHIAGWCQGQASSRARLRVT